MNYLRLAVPHKHPPLAHLGYSGCSEHLAPPVSLMRRIPPSGYLLLRYYSEVSSSIGQFASCLQAFSKSLCLSWNLPEFFTKFLWPPMSNGFRVPIIKWAIMLRCEYGCLSTIIRDHSADILCLQRPGIFPKIAAGLEAGTVVSLWKIVQCVINDGTATHN